MSNEFVILAWGGIGDMLICTPSYKAAREKYFDKKIIVYVWGKSQLPIFENNPHIDSVRILHWKYMWRYPYHLYAYWFNRKLVKYHFMYFQKIPPHWIYAKSVKEIAPEILNVELKDKKVQIFLTEKESNNGRERLLPYKNVILMHIYSKSSVNHHWDMENWEELVRALPDCTFIQLGHVNEPQVRGAIDWRGKTTLREAFALMRHAKSFVGVDSSFAHATNAFDLPGVVLFGDSDPQQWGMDNNINIYKAISCSPCYYYLWRHPCPYGHECMKMITVEEVKEALLKQIYSRDK